MMSTALWYLMAILAGFAHLPVGFAVVGMFIKHGHLHKLVTSDPDDLDLAMGIAVLWPLAVLGFTTFWILKRFIPRQASRLKHGGWEEIWKTICSPIQSMSRYVRWTLSGFSSKK